MAWGSSKYGATNAPTDKGYTRTISFKGGKGNCIWTAFAAIKADGSIMAWGNSNNGGTNAPTDSGYTEIYSNRYAFALSYPTP
jgi:hypothetical protein